MTDLRQELESHVHLDRVEADRSSAPASGRAASIMVTHGFRHLPIVDGERTIWIVSLRDVVRSVVRAYPEYENDTDGDGE